MAARGFHVYRNITWTDERKMKYFMTSLYSYEYKPQEINSKDEENDDINFIIEQDKTKMKRIVK